MYKLLALTILFSTTTFAKTDCERRVNEIVNEYKQNDIKVTGYKLKDCSKSTGDLAGPMNSNSDTNAPKVYSTSACAILLNIKDSPVQELVVIDEENNFELIRDFDNEDKETFSPSRFGDDKTGTILFIKSEGDYKGELGFLNKTYYITRANYDLEEDQMRLLKWKLKWFSNKYSHDYSVQCK